MENLNLEVEKIKDIAGYKPDGEKDWAALKDDARIVAGWYASFLDPKKEIKFSEEEIIAVAVKVYKEIARCKKLDPEKYRYTVNSNEMKPAAEKLWGKVKEKLTKEEIEVLLSAEEDGDAEIDTEKGKSEKETEEKAEEGEAGTDEAETEYADVKPSGEERGREITIEEVLKKFDSFLLRKPFVYLIGGLAIHGKTKGDIDILIKAGEGELPESFTIPLEFRILRMFNPEDRDRVHFVYDRYSGPFTDHYELANLKVERKEKFEKVEMSLDLANLGISKQRTNPGQKQTYNSPTFAYLAVYGKNPDEFLSGRSDHPQRTWEGISVDEPLKDAWLNALKAIEGIEVRASCCGHSAERVSYIIFRLLSGCEIDSKKVSEKLNSVPGCYSLADIGDEGKMRICVAGRTWEGADGWSEWWEKLAGRITEVVEEVIGAAEDEKKVAADAEKSLEPEKVEKEFEAKPLGVWDEISHALNEEVFPDAFVEKAKYFLEVRKAEFRLAGKAGIEANRSARASMREDKIKINRRFYPLKTAVSGLHAYRIAEVYSLSQSLEYLSKLYARGIR